MYDAPKVISGRQFHIVYTSIGAIVWLPDINGWEEVVTHFLKPGGTFYIFEIHPMMLSVSQEDHGDLIVLDWPYFEKAGPMGDDEESSYAGTGKIAHTRQYNFTHGLGETVNALIQAGLQIEFVHEHQVAAYRSLSIFEPTEKGLWKMPDGQENYLPLTFSIKVHKPE